MLSRINLSRVDLNLLVLFEVVIEEGHVGRAAERMSLTPSAVSHGLARLRRLFGDPLFLRTPKGVVPTARATELAAQVADVLARLRNIVETAGPFDPATSTRRFTIGAPDGVSAVLLPPLLRRLAQAPGLRIGIRQLLPAPGETSPGRAWRFTFAELDERRVDVAVIPSDAVPARFQKRCVYEEEFVVALRAAHPLAGDLSLDRYCCGRHVVVSQTGDAHGFVDDILQELGRTRIVVATVPNFMMALAAVAETDMLAALPRSFVAMHAPRFGVVSVEAPVALGRFRLNAVVPQAAMLDAGVAWLFDEIGRAQ